jgi:hypothetical protein
MFRNPLSESYKYHIVGIFNFNVLAYFNSLYYNGFLFYSTPQGVPNNFTVRIMET